MYKKIINVSINILFNTLISDDYITNHLIYPLDSNINLINDNKKLINVSIDINKIEYIPTELSNYLNIKTINIQSKQIIKKQEENDYVILYISKFINPDIICNIAGDFKYKITIFLHKIDDNNTLIKIKNSYNDNEIKVQYNQLMYKMTYNIFISFINNILNKKIIFQYMKKIRMYHNIDFEIFEN